MEQFNKYKDLDELTPYALRELVKGVYIKDPDKSSDKWWQNIRISYDLVGFIPLRELIKSAPPIKRVVRTGTISLHY